jgi:P4 family phage/plasmid primase-like protien
MNDTKTTELEARDLATELDHGELGDELDHDESPEAWDAPPDGDGVELPVLPPGPVRETWIADAWSALNRDAYRYANDLGQWLVFDGVRWSPTVTHTDGATAGAVGEVGSSVAQWLARVAEAEDARAEEAAIEKGIEPGDKGWPKSRVGPRCQIRVLNTIRARAAELLAVITHECMDRDPWTLTTPTGIVNLRSGAMRPATPLDLTMRCTDVAPERIATPLWNRFLGETFGGDPALIGYMQRAVGYWLTGDNSTHAFWILTGSGGNGKGVFLSTIAAAFGEGEYAKTSGSKTFAIQHHEPHPEALASLAQARMIVIAEANAVQLDEGRVKAWSGGDPVRARFMGQNSWEFNPTGKLVFVANDPPTVKRVDDAWSRRVHVVPFNHKPPAPDITLAKRLRAELAGVLQWAVDGAAAYHRDGLLSCEAVREASKVYLQRQDRFTEWLESATAPDVGGKVKLSAVVERYTATGGDALSRGALRKELEARGLKVAMASSRDGEQLHVFGIMLPYMAPTT